MNSPGLAQRWLTPNRKWTGPNALAPTDLCYRILDTMAWGLAAAGVVSGILIVSLDPKVFSSLLALFLVVTVVGALVVLGLRGLPFTLRFILFQAAFSFFAVFPTQEAGILPVTTLVMTVMALTTTLFYGARVGGFHFALMLGVMTAAVWLWTLGYLPLTREAGGDLLRIDHHDPLVWLRVISIQTVFTVMLLCGTQLVLGRLRSSEERFRSTMHSSAIGMALQQPDETVTDVNPALCQLLGYTRAEILERSLRGVTHPEERESADGIFGRVFRGELKAGVRTERYVRKDGRVIWAQVTLSPIHDSAGSTTHLISQVQDVTEGRLNLEQLAEVTERLRMALDIGRLSVWNLWPKTGKVVWDARTYELFQFDQRGEPPTLDQFLERVHPDDRSELRRTLAAGLHGHAEFRLSFRVVLPNGSTRWINSNVAVHRDAKGDPEWLLGVNADVTDVVEATTNAERYRERLLQSQKLEALGRMAGGVTHDFNNLLTGIKCFLRLAASTLPSGHEGAHMLAQAERASDSARDLVRRILQFARQGPSSERAPVRISTVARESEQLIAALMPPSVSFKLDVPDDEPRVHGDAGQFQQILINLCSNAAHAIGSNRGMINLSVDFDPAACRAAGIAPAVRLQVVDTGCGMDQATVARIFDPFFTTKAPGEGTGLGLSTVKSIVQEHGGVISVDSAPGTGTTFTICFPPCETTAVGHPRGPVAAPAATGRERGTVLVIDDEPAAVQTVAAVLRRGGFIIEARTSAHDAWLLLEKAPQRFDLVLTDFNMPEMSGVEFLRRARALSPSLPFIVMTGRNREVLPAEFVDVGFVKKPFEIVDLLESVRASLKRNAALPGSGSKHFRSGRGDEAVEAR